MSFILNEFRFNNKKIVLSYDANILENHTFTIVTGKNSVGKSRLLTRIINHYLRNNITTPISNNYPSKIISVTNIQNDKFPINGNKNSIPYDYFGRKNKYTFNNYDRYSFIKSIIIKNNINSECIKSTFEYLNFNPSFRVIFEKNFRYTTTINALFISILNQTLTRYQNYFQKNINHLGNIKKFLLELQKLENKFKNKHKTSVLKTIVNGLFEESVISNQGNFYLESYKEIFSSLNKNQKFFILCLVNLYKKDIILSEEDFNIIFNGIIIDEGKLEEKLKPYLTFDSSFSVDRNLLLLLHYELIKIKDLIFITKNNSKTIKFDDLSSGQQSILNIYLSISSSIENNSLICIDEPEISLHPEWQTEFIIKIQEIFNFYYGCHFIIATHSPQIVSGLNSQNGFVLDLENNITYKSLDFSKKSADYQLAKVFNSPGFNNEYIIKICLYILSKIKDNENFNHNDFVDIKELKLFSRTLRTDDPVYYLVKEVISLAEE